jgi:hypothetical protein
MIRIAIAAEAFDAVKRRAARRVAPIVRGARTLIKKNPV